MPQKEYSMFWGCMLHTLQISTEVSTRKVLDRLGVKIHGIEGVTCCPEPDVSKSLDYETWLLTAARNLALVEKLEYDVVTICNGCFDTLVEANRTLKEDKEQRGKINNLLSAVGLEFKGVIEVRDILEVLYNDIGILKLGKEIRRPLKGLRVAAQYGCRLFKEEERELVGKFDEIVDILGCERVGYGTERVCCGFPAMYADLDFSIHQRAKMKLDDVKSEEADCIAMLCPACLNHLETAQLTLRRAGIIYNLPCMNLMELIAFAMGFSSKELGFHYHRIKIEETLKEKELGS